MSGRPARWTALPRVLLEDDAGNRERFEIVGARAYGDRLVLAFRGVEDAAAAERLRGRTVLAPEEEVPELPEGRYYLARLLGLDVFEEDGTGVGRVEDVMEAGGNEVLVVVDETGDEILVPLVREIVLEVDENEGRVTVRLPRGLRELNRRTDRR